MKELIHIVIYMGAVQGFFLMTFLFTTRPNRLANRLLGLLALTWSLVLLNFALQEEGLYLWAPHLLLWAVHLLFLVFPLLFLFVKYLLTSQDGFQRRDLLHFLPFFMCLAFHLDFFFLDGPTKLELVQHPTPSLERRWIIVEQAIAIQGIVYVVWALNWVFRYIKRRQNYLSSPVQRILKLLVFTLVLHLGAWVLGILGTQLDYAQIDLGIDFFALTYLFPVLAIYSLSFMAIRSPELFKIDPQALRGFWSRPFGLKDALPYGKEGIGEFAMDLQTQGDSLEEGELKELDERLLDFMLKKKPYLNPEMSLPELAHLLDVPRNKLSMVINLVHNLHFHDFINRFRVEEVKQLMSNESSKKLTLVALANQAGFSSKASFYRAFKKWTGLTPSAFLSQLDWPDGDYHQKSGQRIFLGRRY